MNKVLLSSGLVRGMGAGGLARLLVGLVLLGSALMACATPSAFAAYEITGTFAGDGPGAGGSGSADGQLSDPGQADVLNTTGALYVADTANNRVQVFTPTPTGAGYSFQAAVSSPTGLAIDQTDGSVYVATATGIAKLNSDLTPAAGWTDPAVTGSLTLAVDPTDGDLLVADRDASLIRRFASDGTAGTTFAAARPLDVAADSTGGLFVVTSTGDIYDSSCATSAVERFDASGLAGLPFPTVWAPGSVAVDPDDDSVVVAKRVNTYNCREIGTGELPEVAIFSNAGIAGPVLPLDALFADIPGLAVAGAGSGRIYAVTKSPYDDIFGPTRVTAIRNLIPSDATIAATSAVTPTSAQVNGSANPNGRQTSAHFEYRRVGVGAGWTSLPDHDIGAGSSPVDVTDQLTGLAAGRPYAVRLVATNDDGTAISTVGEFTTPIEAPVVQTRPVSELTAAGARLRGTVDPRGGATTYHFEYGTTAAYGTQIPLTPRAVDPSGPSTVSQLISGLQPGTTYHYRVVAINSAGTAHGADLAFATPAGDPAQRVYEKVSPDNKHNYEVYIEQAGSGATGALYEPIAAADGSRVGFISRGAYADAATSQALNDFSAQRTASGWVTQSYGLKGAVETRLFAWSEDLSHAVYANAGVPAGSRTQGPAVITANETPDTANLFQITTDGKRFVAATPDPDLGQSGNSLYYVGGSADLSTLVYRDGVRRTAGAPSGWNVYAWHDDRPGVVDLVSVLPDPDGAGPLVGVPAPGATVPTAPNTVSEDGSKIFFTTTDGRLYVRVDGQRTIEVSASQKATPDLAQPVTLGMATKDGGKALFTTAEQLIDTDTDADPDLYRYDLATGHLDRLVQGSATVLGASHDGSYVYYLAGDVKLWHDGHVRDVGPTIGTVPTDTVRVSADGTGIVYMGPDGVDYYDADTDELQCVSCREDGVPSTRAELPSVVLGPINFNSNGKVGNPQRSITSNGDRVFFTSFDPLVGGDVNNRADAYEFYDGRPHLVSSGRGVSNAFFLDASADGRDVFLGTREKLLPADGDDGFDIYDARVGGGFPAELTKAPCDGEGCQGATSTIAAPPVIGTVAFGEDDVLPTRGSVSASRSVTGSVVRLRVKVSGRGRIAVSGSAIKPSARSAGKAGTYTLTLGLTAKAKKTLAKRKSLKATAKVVFTPASGRPVTTSVALSFKQPQPKRKAGR